MLKQRYAGSWSLVFDDYQTDPATGARTRKRKWVTFHGDKRAAEKKLNELLRDVGRGEWVEPTTLTLGAWLTDWIEKAIKPPLKAQATYEMYQRIIERHITPKLGTLRLQALKPIDLEAYYGTLTLAPATIGVHHAILHGAFRAALKANLVSRNVAALATNKPKVGSHEDVLDHVWTADEASTFLATAKQAGPQPAAFYALLLDSGCRKGEAAALAWSDLDLASGKLTIRRTLLKGGRDPVFGPTKTKRVRTIDLATETIALLKAHRAHQAEIKMRNRKTYRDLNLIFAKAWGDVHNRAETLGGPLQVNTIGSREFDRLIKAAGVKRIKLHGCRHTVATLMLSAGVPAHVVQRRLGHSKVEMTLNLYSHVLPDQGQDAATKLAALLHG
jgi:integrase